MQQSARTYGTTKLLSVIVSPLAKCFETQTGEKSVVSANQIQEKRVFMEHQLKYNRFGQ